MKKCNLHFISIFAALFFLISVNPVEAQYQYSKLIDDTTIYSLLVEGVSELPSKKVAVVCTKDNFPSLIILDSMGSIVSAKAFQLSTGNYDPNYTIVSPTQDGGFVCGGTHNGSSFRSEQIIKFDGTGVLQWTTLLSSGCQPGFRCVKELGNGNFVTISNTPSQTSTCIPEYGFYVSLLSPSGVLLSSCFYYHDSIALGVKDIIETPDGYIYISGNIAQVNQCGGAILMKFSNTLQLLWSKLYEDADTGSCITTEFYTKDNLIYMDGNIYMSFTYNGYDSTVVYHNFGLMKTDTSGQVFWSYEYSRPNQETLMTILPGNGGQIVLSSQLYSSSYILNGLTQVDTAGSVLDDGFLTLPSTHFMRSTIIASQDSGYYVTGIYFPLINGPSVYIVKSNQLSNLCYRQSASFNVSNLNMSAVDFTMDTLPGLVQNSITLTSFSFLLTNQNFCAPNSTGNLVQDSRLLIFPNPANEDFICFDIGSPIHEPFEIDIYDAAGRLVLSENISSENTKPRINISGLNNGLYFASLKSGTKLAHQVFSVMH